VLRAPPTPRQRHRAAQALGAVLEPLRLRHGLPPCAWRAGTLAMRVWGRTLRCPDGTFEIALRAHAEPAAGQPLVWRRPAALVATALHELAHLRYRGHGPRFWSLVRRLLDEAAAAGIYVAADDDPGERGRGDAKLRGSAAHGRAEAARAARADQRRLARVFQAGQTVRVVSGSPRLAGHTGVVERRGRTRLLVRLGERLYWIPSAWIQRDDESTTDASL